MSRAHVIGLAVGAVAVLAAARWRGRRQRRRASDEKDLRRLQRLSASGLQASVQVSSTRKRRRVGVYGGAFDPITNGHLQLATEIIHSGQVDEMWLCPCGARPDKPTMTQPGYRCAMAELAVNQGVAPSFPLYVVDHEVKEPTLAGADGSVATYDSLRFLAEQHKDCDISFVIGSDWLRPGTDLRLWTSKEGKTGDRLLSEFDFLVLPRVILLRPSVYRPARAADSPHSLMPRVGRRAPTHMAPCRPSECMAL